jgi:DNA-binding SARP family transcriptional activator
MAVGVPLALKLFGQPSLTLLPGHTAAPLSGAKDLALLAFLTLEPGPHSREQLATLLWGESLEEAARASFRQALLRLNRVLGKSLRSDRTTVELVEPPDCDVLRFEAALARDPESAAEFKVLQFFQGLTVLHSPAFEEWASEKRQTLSRKYLELLGSLTRDAMYQWRWREAAKWAERWVEEDPYSDEACRVAMEALYLAGDHGSALRHYQEFEARIRPSAIEPSAALIKLKRRVESDRGPSTRKQVSDQWLVHPPRLDAALVGREEHWRTLVETWRLVARGRGQVTLIEGEAGAGKTRLAEEFLRWGGAEGATVLRGRGYDPKDGTPFDPVVEALRAGLDAPGLAGADPEWLSEISRLLPEIKRRFPGLPESPTLADSAGRWRLFEGVAQVVMAIASENPVIVLIDDLQWCDGETCALLHFLARRWATVPVFFLATATLGELERDAPAARLIRALRIQSHATVISLGPLSEEQVLGMIHELGRLKETGAGRRFAHRVYEVTSGNPFYIIELLKTLFAQGLLAVDNATGTWKTGPEVGPDESRPIPMPRTVQDAIAQRVSRLPEQLRDLLATVVLAGQFCEPDLLSLVHGISRLHVASLCDELVGRRLLTEATGSYRPAHSLVADVVHEELTSSRRREIHRSIALALESIAKDAKRDDLVGRIARHAEHGGETRKAFLYAQQASERAHQRYAMEEALSWLDLAAATASTPAESDEVNRRTAELLELAGWTEPPDGIRRPTFVSEGLVRSDFDFQ